MPVKIVTDSSSDIPENIAKELDISIIPLYVRFGEEVLRDGIDITGDKFYQRLVRDTVNPSTIQPSPQDFSTVYQELVKGKNSIISIHISNKLSGTYNSACLAKQKLDTSCQIQVLDSGVLSVALGLIVIEAAKMAKAGAGFNEVLKKVNDSLPELKLMGLLDTLKYVMLGGRIGKAKALLGSILNVKPMLTLKDGEVMPVGQVRSRSKGIEKLVEFVHAGTNVKHVAVACNTTPDEADILAGLISDAGVIAREKIIIGRIGPMLGVHLGPGSLIVAYF